MAEKKLLVGGSVALVILLLFTCGTQKKKEQAEQHYQAGLALQQKAGASIDNEVWLDSALVEFKRALKLDPTHTMAHRSYIDIMRWQKNQEDEVLAEYQQKARKYPDSEVYHYLLGRLSDDPDQKKQAALKAIEINPRYYWGHILLGSVYQEAEDHVSAIEEYKKAIAIDSTATIAYSNITNSYASLDSFDLSTAMYKKVMEFDSTNDYVYYSIWRNMIQKEGLTPQVKQKIGSEIDDLLQQKGEVIAVLNSAVWTYRSLGELDKVKALEEKILQIDTTGNWSQNILLNRLYQIGDPQERLNACEQFISENPNSRMKPYVFSFGANVIRDQLKLGEEKAIEWGERWIQECPDDATAYNDLVWFVYQHHEDKLDKALEYMKTAAAVARPYQKNYIMDTLGWIYFKKGMYPDALTTMEQAMKLYKDDPSAEVIFHYGAVLAKNGKLDEGLENIALALSQEEIEEARKLFTELYKEKFGSEQGSDEYLTKTILGKASVAPYTVPAFELTNLNGEKVNFSDYLNKSKVILVAFWMPT